MYALTGKAGNDHIVSFFLSIDMNALTGKNYADRRYISIKRKNTPLGITPIGVTYQ
jgi:hypothetical protein